jgi:hypothetical protein
MYYVMLKKMDGATFWAIFPQTRLVTLDLGHFLKLHAHFKVHACDGHHNRSDRVTSSSILHRASEIGGYVQTVRIEEDTPFRMNSQPAFLPVTADHHQKFT